MDFDVGPTAPARSPQSGKSQAASGAGELRSAMERAMGIESTSFSVADAEAERQMYLRLMHEFCKRSCGRLAEGLRKACGRPVWKKRGSPSALLCRFFFNEGASMRTETPGFFRCVFTATNDAGFEVIGPSRAVLKKTEKV
eukprot:scaffold3146_cov245-Pinguiococcus_pyrenoidosus.AAC.7